MESQLILIILVLLALKSVDASKLDQLRESVTSEDQRSFIKISVLLDTAPRVVAAQLETAVLEGHLKERQVYNWYNDFKDVRRTDVSDLPKPGRPREATTE